MLAKGEHRTALVRAARFLACLTRGAEDSCRPTSDQKTKSVKAFNALSPIFQDQRCLNCHGAVNPFIVEAKKFLEQPNRASGLIETAGPGAVSELRGIREIECAVVGK